MSRPWRSRLNADMLRLQQEGLMAKSDPKGRTRQFQVTTSIGEDRLTAIVTIKAQAAGDDRAPADSKAAAIDKARALAQQLLDETSP